MSRLQALSKASKPEIHEVEKWYRRLDQLIDGCSTDDFSSITSAFSKERPILTESGKWEGTVGVFLTSNEEDAPGAETVRASVRDLTLWRKIGVEDRPSPELAIKWLQSLPSGTLSHDDARRARALLARHAVRVWEKCQHLLNLSGEWTPVDDFDYALTMQPLIPWSHLHQWVKDKTANLQDLAVDITQTAPFAGLPLLAAHMEERFHRRSTDSGNREERGWLKQLGLELQRIKLRDENETERIRALACELASTAWQTTRDLEIISYIDGKPAGTPRRADAIWSEGTLHAEDKPLAKLARAVALELGRSFRNVDITDAIKLCFERPPEFVTEYMEGNFTLLPREQVEGSMSELPANQNETPVSTESVEPQHAEGTQTSSDNDPETDEVELVDEIGTEAEDEPDKDGDETSEDDDESDCVVSTRHVRHKPPKPGIMERFALRQGFQKDEANRFFDDHGNWIAKANGGLFPWEQRSASGEVIRHFWPKDHCLERDPLQLAAEIWSIVEKFPETYVLVLSDPEGQPVEITGGQLREMQERGELTLHPSTYRLVYENDEQV